MARNVGSIEVTVEASTGKLTAQLRTAGRRAGEAAASEIDRALNDVPSARTLARIRQRIQRGLEGVEAEVGVSLNSRDLRRTIGELEALAELADADVAIGAKVNATSVRRAITEIRAMVAAADIDVNIGSEVDLAQVIASVAALKTAVAGVGAAVGAVETGLSGLGDAVSGSFTTSGKASADAFSSAFTSAMSSGGRGAPIAGAIATAIALAAQPISVAIAGTFGAAIAVVSSGMSALLGTVGAGVPILTGLGATVTTLAIGFEGLGAALDGDADALANLTPQARAFVEAFDDIRPVFDDIRRSVQGRLFEGLAAEIRRIAAEALPQIRVGLDDTADSLNQFFHDLADVAAGVDFAAIFEALHPITVRLLGVVTELAKAIEPFLLAAADAAELLAWYLVDGARGMAEMIAAGEGSGALRDFLVEGVRSLQVWAGLAGNVADALVTLFGAGRAAGDSFVASLSGVIEEFDEWMEGVAGQEALADFFADAREIIVSMAPLVEGLVGFFDRIVTPDAIHRFGQITDIIGDLLPVLGTLLESLGDISGPWIDAIGVVTDGLALLAKAWEAIPDPIREWALAMVAGTVALKALTDLLPPLIGWLVDLDDALDIDPPPWLRVLVPLINLVDLALGDHTDAVEGTGKAWGTLGDEATKTATEGGLLGKVLDDVGLSMSFNEKATKAATRAGEEQARVTAEQRAAAERLVEALTKATQAHHALAKIAGTFEQIGIRQDALSALFDLGNAPLDAAASVRDIGLAIDELSDTAEGVKVGDILAGNLKADDVLDAIDSMRPQIQAQITDAFAAGGPEAAVAMAHDYIAQVAAELGVTDIEAAKLLGLEGIEATIAVALKLADIDKARRQLEVLTGLTGETTWSASVALALDREGITDQEVADILAGIEARLRAEGVIIPIDTTLTPPSGEDLYNLVNAGLMAQGFEPIDIPLDVLPPTAAEAEPVINAALAAVNLNPITADVTGPLPSDLEDAIDFVTAGIVPDPVKVPVEFTQPVDPLGLLGAIGGITVPVIPPIVVPATMNTDDFDTAAEGVQSAVDGLNSSTAAPSVEIPNYDTVIGQTDDIQQAVDTLDETTATPTITVNTSAAVTSVGNLQRAIDGLRGKSITISVPGLQTSIDKVRELDREIDGLRSKTITITTNLVTTGTAESMAGRIVNAPMLTTVGERGYREAIIPLDLPLNRVSPDVRHLAAMLRGETTNVAVAPGGPRTVITQNFALANADPRAVATQVLNRAAAAANR